MYNAWMKRHGSSCFILNMKIIICKHDSRSNTKCFHFLFLLKNTYHFFIFIAWKYAGFLRTQDINTSVSDTQNVIALDGFIIFFFCWHACNCACGSEHGPSRNGSTGTDGVGGVFDDIPLVWRCSYTCFELLLWDPYWSTQIGHFTPPIVGRSIFCVWTWRSHRYPTHFEISVTSWM